MCLTFHLSDRDGGIGESVTVECRKCGTFNTDYFHRMLVNDLHGERTWLAAQRLVGLIEYAQKAMRINRLYQFNIDAFKRLEHSLLLLQEMLSTEDGMWVTCDEVDTSEINE